MQKTTVVPCPICGSENTKYSFNGYDIRFGYPGTSDLYQCRDCHHLFAGGDLDPNCLTDMYTNYYPRTNFDVEDYEPYRYRRGLLSWLDGDMSYAYRQVPRDARVLDIGCGYCETLGYHQNRGCEVYGVEADENAGRIAKRYGFNVKLGLFNPGDWDSDYFDYTTMDHVMEHMTDPIQTLRGIAQVLKSPGHDTEGGRVAFSVPNVHSLGRRFFGKSWAGWHHPFHRQFYSEKSIRIMAEKAGFEVERLQTLTESDYLIKNWALFLYPTKKKGTRMSDVYLTDGRFNKQEMKSGSVMFFHLLHRSRLFAPWMRLADLFGIGDWYLAVLRKR